MAKLHLVATTDDRFGIASDGRVGTTGISGYAAWSPYLSLFDQVTVLARVSQTLQVSLPVEGPGVAVVALDDARGVREVLSKVPRYAEPVLTAVLAADLVLLRVPGVISTLAWYVARLVGRPFAAFVVGDPLESTKRLAGGLVARPLARRMRAQVRHARTTAFVTSSILQRRYPPDPALPTFVMSNALLPDEIFETPPRPTRAGPALDLVFVAALYRSYKGLDWLIDALAMTKFPHRLTVVGDGPLRQSLEQHAMGKGLQGRVTFVGARAGASLVRAEMSGHDLFVLPSRTEGMPRVLLEAMSVGLPCVATPVGGVVEILSGRFLVPVDQPAVLASRLDELGAAPLAREEAGRRNREVASKHRASERARQERRFIAVLAAIAAGAPIAADW